jgi:hypothetical protein
MASIRAGKPINEAQSIAESTLTGIMGRDSAYTGKTLEWEQVLNSQRGSDRRNTSLETFLSRRCRCRASISSPERSGC